MTRPIWTTAQFLAAVQRAAASLRGHGVSAGDVVAIMLPNTASFVVSLFAAWRLGAAVTPINPSLPRGGQLPGLRRRRQGADRRDDARVRRGAPAVETDQLDGGEPTPGADAPHEADDALALLIYTSGTTGRPKGVMLDHANLDAMCNGVIDAFKLTAADHSLLILPLFHVNGIVVGTLSPLLAGRQGDRGGPVQGRSRSSTGSSRAAPRTSPPYQPFTRCCAACPPSVKPDTSSVRFAICGAAPASVELLEAFESRYGIPMIEGYGLSEGSCASTVNPLDGKRKPGTVGLPGAGPDDPYRRRGGRAVPDGEAGEVVIKGPNVMRGYLNRPEETAKTIVDGWLHTGDVGRFDEDGYLVLVDRAKDMIIRGGENIYPREIEAVVHGLPPDRRGRRRRQGQRGLRRRAGAVRVAASPTDARHRRDPRAPQRVIVEIQTAGGDHDHGGPSEEPGRQDRQAELRKRLVRTG